MTIVPLKRYTKYKESWVVTYRYVSADLQPPSCYMRSVRRTELNIHHAHTHRKNMGVWFGAQTRVVHRVRNNLCFFFLGISLQDMDGGGARFCNGEALGILARSLNYFVYFRGLVATTFIPCQKRTVPQLFSSVFFLLNRTDVDSGIM